MYRSIAARLPNLFLRPPDTRPILDHIENLHSNRNEYDTRAGRNELLRYIESAGVDDLEPCSSYLLSLDAPHKAVRLAEIPGHIGVAFPRALALAEGEPGWSTPASNMAWCASLIAPNGKLARYYDNLATRLAELPDGSEVADPHAKHQADLAAVEALAGWVDRHRNGLTSLGLDELKSLVRMAAQNAQHGTYDATLRLVLPSDVPRPHRNVRNFELPVGRAMSMAAYYSELHGSAADAQKLSNLISRWYPDASLRVPIGLPASGRYTLLQIAPVVGYERRFMVKDHMPGSISLDHYGKGRSRYSPEDTELPFRIHREEDAVLAALNFERVMLVSDTHSYYAAMIWQKA